MRRGRPWVPPKSAPKSWSRPQPAKPWTPPPKAPPKPVARPFRPRWAPTFSAYRLLVPIPWVIQTRACTSVEVSPDRSSWTLGSESEDAGDWLIQVSAYPEAWDRNRPALTLLLRAPASANDEDVARLFFAFLVGLDPASPEARGLTLDELAGLALLGTTATDLGDGPG